MDKRTWDNSSIFIFSCHFSLPSWNCILVEIFSQFFLRPPYIKLKLEPNSGYTRPTLLVGWGEGLDLCELENAPDLQKCPKTFVHDCNLLNNPGHLRTGEPVFACFETVAFRLSYLCCYLFRKTSYRHWPGLKKCMRNFSRYCSQTRWMDLLWRTFSFHPAISPWTISLGCHPLGTLA